MRVLGWVLAGLVSPHLSVHAAGRQVVGVVILLLLVLSAGLL